MARPGVTFEDVTAAADALLARGERPTVDGVRAELGTGSPANVNALLRRYFATLAGRLSLPAPIAAAAAELYRTIRAQAIAEAEARAETLREALADEQQRLVSDRRSFESERTRLVSEASALSANLDTARSQALELKGQLAAREEALEGLRIAGGNAQRALQQATVEHERIAGELRQTVALLQERVDREQQHFLGKIADAHAEAARATRERDKERDAAARRVAALEAETNRLAGELDGARKEQVRLNAALDREQRARKEAEEQLSTLKEQHAAALGGARGERDTAFAELRQTQAALAETRKQLEVGLSETGRARARADALEGQLDQLRAQFTELEKRRRK